MATHRRVRDALIPTFVFLIPFDGIDEIHYVTAKCELFGGSLKMLGAAIFLPLPL